MPGLRSACRDIGLPATGRRETLVGRLAPYAGVPNHASQRGSGALSTFSAFGRAGTKAVGNLVTLKKCLLTLKRFIVRVQYKVAFTGSKVLLSTCVSSGPGLWFCGELVGVVLASMGSAGVALGPGIAKLCLGAPDICTEAGMEAINAIVPVIRSELMNSPSLHSCMRNILPIIARGNQSGSGRFTKGAQWAWRAGKHSARWAATAASAFSDGGECAMAFRSSLTNIHKSSQDTDVRKILHTCTASAGGLTFCLSLAMSVAEITTSRKRGQPMTQAQITQLLGKLCGAHPSVCAGDGGHAIKSLATTMEREMMRPELAACVDRLAALIQNKWRNKVGGRLQCVKTKDKDGFNLRCDNPRATRKKNITTSLYPYDSAGEDDWEDQIARIQSGVNGAS